MHIQARRFIEFVKKSFPDYFRESVVLDVGAGDINGNNRFLFENCQYEGNDLIRAPNVTVISRTKNLKFPDKHFDVICSTECFEHDAEYRESLQKIMAMLKDGGLFFFTCASLGRPEHGTIRTTPGCSYGTIGGVDGFTDYYKNLTIIDIQECLDFNDLFSSWKSWYNKESKDLYFIGFKKQSNTPPPEIPDYMGHQVYSS